MSSTTKYDLDQYKTDAQRQIEEKRRNSQQAADINYQKLQKYLPQQTKGYSIGMTETAKIAANNAYQRQLAQAESDYNADMTELNNYVRQEQERLDDKAKAEQDANYNEIMSSVRNGEYNTVADLDKYLGITTNENGDKVFGESGNRVVIEEFLTGPEVSVLSFTDGKTVVPMISSMDHKRAYDNDEGLNTGGMGVIAPNPFYTREVADECMETIFLPTMNAMNAEGRTFKGCLYFGLMLTPKGPKVIEYNCRFGDPETQVVLPLLDSDLLTVMMATTNGTLADCEVRFSQGAAACVIMASGGYPTAYKDCTANVVDCGE